MDEYEEIDDFEDRFADELENLADFESQDSLPILQPVKKPVQIPSSGPPPRSVPSASSQSAKNAANDFFGGTQSRLSYPDDDDDDLEAAVAASNNRKRPTSGDADKNVEKRPRLEIDADVDDDADHLVIDDSADNRRGVFDAINGDIPNGSSKNVHRNGGQPPSVSLSSVLKNKGDPLHTFTPIFSDDGTDAFSASNFKTAREASAPRKTNPLERREDRENSVYDRVPNMAPRLQDDVERRRVRKHPPSTDDYVYVTEGGKGKRIYLAVKPEDDDHVSSKFGFSGDDSDAEDGGGRRSGRQLLGIDFNVLKRRVMLEMEARETAVRADEMDDDDIAAEVEIVGEAEPEAENHNLWVDKYAPRGYTVDIDFVMFRRGFLSIFFPSLRISCSPSDFSLFPPSPSSAVLFLCCRCSFVVEIISNNSTEQD